MLTPFLDVWNTSFPHAQTSCESIQSSQTSVIELRPTRVLIQLSYWFSPVSQGFCHKLPTFPSFSLAHQPLQQGDSAHQATKSPVSSFMNGAGAQSEIWARSLHLRVIRVEFVQEQPWEEMSSPQRPWWPRRESACIELTQSKETWTQIEAWGTELLREEQRRGGRAGKGDCGGARVGGKSWENEGKRELDTPRSEAAGPQTNWDRSLNWGFRVLGLSLWSAVSSWRWSKEVEKIFCEDDSKKRERWDNS